MDSDRDEVLLKDVVGNDSDYLNADSRYFFGCSFIIIFYLFIFFFFW